MLTKYKLRPSLVILIRYLLIDLFGYLKKKRSVETMLYYDKVLIKIFHCHTDKAFIITVV